MKDFSYITNSHPAYIEGLYNDFVHDPESVDPEFRKFFEGFDFAFSNNVNGHAVAPAETQGQAIESAQLVKEFAVYNLILSYRKKGHLEAKTNPIRERKNRGANLDLKFFGLSETDLSTQFFSGKFIGLSNATLQQIIQHLQKIYTSHVGIEYQYINKYERLEWLENEIENTLQQPVPLQQKKRILDKLN